MPGLVRSPGEGIGYSLQYYGQENSMDCIVHEVAGFALLLPLNGIRILGVDSKWTPSEKQLNFTIQNKHY